MENKNRTDNVKNKEVLYRVNKQSNILRSHNFSPCGRNRIFTYNFPGLVFKVLRDSYFNRRSTKAGQSKAQSLNCLFSCIVFE
jgi:hypothetical protein